MISKLKDINISSYILIILVVFIVITFLGYKLLKNQIIVNHEKDTKILYSQIKMETSDLLTRLLYQRSIQKEKLINKHKQVQKYLENKDALKIDLAEIYRIINKGETNNPYNIYITNKDLLIKNTTYKPDLDFDVSFAKPSFDRRFEKNFLACSSPYFKKEKKQFFSYSDSYFIKEGEKNGVLQLSYTYQNTISQYNKIIQRIKNNSQIKDLRAYVTSESQHISKVSFVKISSYQPTLNEMISDIKNGSIIKSSLQEDSYLEQQVIENNIEYKNILLLAKSPLFNKSQIIYSILLDESEHKHNLALLNYIMIFIAILGVISIFVISIIRAKETKLNQQDKFVQHSMHEIKTPLSIITLNNELRELELGKDEYSKEINNALKTLENSYQDMSYSVVSSQINYEKKPLILSEIIEERIEYFRSLATIREQDIKLVIKSDCIVEMSIVESHRVIDNNLSNAINMQKLIV